MGMATSPLMTRPLAVIWSLAILSIRSIPSALGLETNGIQYVIVSQPRLKSVTYAKVNIFTYSAGNETFPLVTAGLKNPLGLAVDNKRQRLFVADSEAGKVFMYNLIFDKGDLKTDGRPAMVAASGLEPRWVAVNEAGDIYVSDEPQNLIAKVTATQLKSLDATPTTLFAGSSLGVVSTPGGVAVDDKEVFWVNKAEGKSKGSIIRGREMQGGIDTKEKSPTKILAQNTDKAFGCCAAGNNIFYTGEEKYVYAVKKTGGTAVVVVDSMVAPRGCTWDGSGTVYIADRSANALRFFPSSMHSLQLAQVETLMTVEDPFGVAVAILPPKAPAWEGAAKIIPFLHNSATSVKVLAPLLLATLAVVI